MNFVRHPLGIALLSALAAASVQAAEQLPNVLVTATALDEPATVSTDPRTPGNRFRPTMARITSRSPTAHREAETAKAHRG